MTFCGAIPRAPKHAYTQRSASPLVSKLMPVSKVRFASMREDAHIVNVRIHLKDFVWLCTSTRWSIVRLIINDSLVCFRTPALWSHSCQSKRTSKQRYRFVRGQLLGASIVFHSFLMFAAAVFPSDKSSGTPDLCFSNHLGARSPFAAYQL